MILLRSEILKAQSEGSIVIEPFNPENLGGNSYDVRLSPFLKVYSTAWNYWTSDRLASYDNHFLMRCFYDRKHLFRGNQENPRASLASQGLDCALKPDTIDLEIPSEGLVLLPGIMYLGSTVEYTETHKHVPYLDGRSSAGRLSISVHATAGRGDVGFCNHWTMEITVTEPVRVYAGMKIGQLTYHTVDGTSEHSYATKPSCTYGMTKDPKPQESRMWVQVSKMLGR